MSDAKLLDCKPISMSDHVHLLHGEIRAHVLLVPTTFGPMALARRYAQQQRDFGNREPAVVRTMAEAYELLGMDTPNFAAVLPPRT
jgi:hypothetical protein